MSKLTYIAATAIFVIVALAIVSWSLGLNKPPAKPSQKAQQTATQSAQSKERIIPLPVSTRSTFVRAAEITYTFGGTLKAINNTAEGVELVVDFTAKGLPKFIVKENTEVVLNTYGQSFQKATSSNLAVNQNILIEAAYDLNTATWSVQKVHILVDSSSTPTTTSTNIQQ